MNRREEGHPRRHLAFGAVALGTFMSTLDASAVNIALPAMAAQFGADLGKVEWVVLSYLLTLVALLLNAGRLADLLGRRTTYAAGLLVFGASSLGCGLAQQNLSLVLFRAVQGVGGALMNAAGPAILTEIYPRSQRGRVLGFAGLAVSAGLAAGPAVGGFVISALSWHWIFFPNVPLSLLAALVALRAVPAGSRRAQAFDWTGSLLLSAAMACLLLVLSQGPTWGFGSALSLSLFALTGGIGALFIHWERRAPSPVLDLRLFRDRTFAGSAVAGLLVFLTLGTVNLVMPFYLGTSQGLGTRQMGWVLSALPLAMAVVSPLAGWLADRLGSTRGLAATGAVLAAAALLGLAGLAASVGAGVIALLLACLGLAMGLFQSPNNSALMSAVPRSHLGTAGGLLATVRVSGLLVGNAVGGAIFLAASGGVPQAEAVAEGLRAAALIGAGTGLGAGVASLARGRGGAR